VTVRTFSLSVVAATLQNLRTTSVTQTTIALAWDAYPGATAYQVRRNGTLLSTPTGTTYSNSGHTAGTSYTYAVRPVVGGSGVASAEASIQVTTSGGATYTPTHYVTATASGSGDGTIGNPWTAQQAVANAQAGNVVQWGPGVYLLNCSLPLPALVLANNGTAGNPIIHFAQSPAISASSDAQRTILRTASGTGSLMGQRYGTGGSYTTIDGFQFEARAPYSLQDGSDGYSLFLMRGMNNVRILRCAFDMGDMAPYSNAMWGGIWGQEVNTLEIADCIFRNSARPVTHQHSAILFYALRNFEIHHNTFSDLNEAIFLKGAVNGIGCDGGSIHHNRISDTNHPFYFFRVNVSSASLYVDVYQNLVTDITNTSGMANTWNGEIGASNRNVRMVNNTFYNWTATGGSGFGQNYYTSGPDLTGVVWRNNIWHTMSGDYIYETAYATNFENQDFDRNFYWAVGNIGRGVSFSAWQGSPRFNDPNSSQLDPQLVSPATGDFRLATGAGARNFGTDVLNLLGNGTSSPINCGAYITAGQTDQIGVRS
jgi:hypothetical protein